MTKEQLFNAAKSELHRGINLVEASAGTGKTFAIAMLVLRFVVEKEIPLENLLIVTFTNAATRELRGRIRRRLVEARDILECRVDDEREVFDQPLRDWSAQFTDKKRRDYAGRLLQQALYSIDQAPVFTIHGFCQRMLTEQALESGQAFDRELLTDLTSLKQEIAEDYWRALFYQTDSGLEAVLLSDSRFVSPAALLDSVSRVNTGCRFVPQDPDGAERAACHHAVFEHFRKIRCWWRKDGGLLRETIEQAEKGGYLNKDFAQGWREWLETLKQWCCSDDNRSFFIHPEWLAEETFLESRLLNRKKLKGDAIVDFLNDWPLYPYGESFLRQLDTLFLLHRVAFATFLQRELSRRLTRQGGIDFDGLVDQLAGALAREKEGARTLQQRIADRFAVALIDEFQDTDSRQYHIFSRIFGGGTHFLYLIGDPKQAIYRFRGADIHSYFSAREAATKLLTLNTNYRSHPLLIGEINRLFSERENPFFYSAEKLPFWPVNARNKEECADLRQKDGRIASGMVYWVLPPNTSKKNGRWSAGAARKRIMAQTVTEIARLLVDGQYRLSEDGGRSLAPRDIAVLVRSNETAETYANALADSGIPAVVTSRTSVFLSAECNDLLLLLTAILAPNDVPRAKAARTLSWFGCDGADIYEMIRDERRLGRWQLDLMEYGRQWHTSGFFSMMATLLHREGVFVRLAEGIRGERSIANIRQLLVLMEEEALARNLQPQELCQWLARQNREPEGRTESELLLESDREAVQIVTMHSAKGLEYGVVFCVDLWGGSDRLADEENQIVYQENDEAGLIIDLGSEQFAANRDMAREDLRAEDVRLLYVAVTRAKIRCYTVWADVSGRKGSTIDSFSSALGYLLFEGKCAASAQQDRIAARTTKEGVSLQILNHEPQPECSSTILRGERQKLQRCRLQRDKSGAAWQLSSFSSLSGLSEYDMAGVPDDREEGAEIGVIGLPAGAHFGSLVHDVLENSSFPTLAADRTFCIERCREAATMYGVHADPEKLAELIQQTLQTPLMKDGDDSFRLARMSDEMCLKEMPFYLRHQAVQTDNICRLLADDPAVVPLGRKEIEGYLTGFIDLVCRWRDRFYIIDYKTNNLGTHRAAYQGDGLQAAMRSHNYGLQYWLYTVALHRYLGSVEDGYDYNRHFGGICYLFVRGMAADSPGSGVFFAVPPEEKVRNLDILLGGTV